VIFFTIRVAESPASRPGDDDIRIIRELVKLTGDPAQSGRGPAPSAGPEVHPAPLPTPVAAQLPPAAVPRRDSNAQSSGAGSFLVVQQSPKSSTGTPNDHVVAPRRGGMRPRANTDPAGSGRGDSSVARILDGTSSNQSGRSHGGRPGLPIPPSCKRFDIGTSLGTPRSLSIGGQSVKRDDMMSPDKRRCVRYEAEMGGVVLEPQPDSRPGRRLQGKLLLRFRSPRPLPTPGRTGTTLTNCMRLFTDSRLSLFSGRAGSRCSMRKSMN